MADHYPSSIPSPSFLLCPSSVSASVSPYPLAPSPCEEDIEVLLRLVAEAQQDPPVPEWDEIEALIKAVGDIISSPEESSSTRSGTALPSLLDMPATQPINHSFFSGPNRSFKEKVISAPEFQPMKHQNIFSDNVQYVKKTRANPKVASGKYTQGLALHHRSLGREMHFLAGKDRESFL